MLITSSDSLLIRKSF